MIRKGNGKDFRKKREDLQQQHLPVHRTDVKSDRHYLTSRTFYFCEGSLYS